MQAAPEIRSMTGYGGRTVELAGARVAVEARSVNSRHFDVKVRLPWPSPRLESRLGQAIRRAVIRGRVDLTVRMEAGGDDDAALGGAADALRRAHRALAEVARELSLGAPSLSDVVAHAALIDSRSRDAVLPAQAEEVLAQALAGALEDLEEMRRSEGSAMARALAEQLDELQARLGRLEDLAREQPDRIAERVQARVERLLGELGAAPEALEASRLTGEIALIADRADVTEELARLRSHVDQFRGILAGPAPHGRRLEFLLQEMNREVNTTGAKAQDGRMQSQVVEAKSILEKLREVTLNVE